MKKLLVLLLSCIPLFSTAQSLTTAQREKALQCATKFCDLLVRYSEGERTLNTQINAICSGADCSAFDDIKTDKEVTLRNYLLAIQQKYPKSLAMTISTPSLANSQTYIEPVFGGGREWDINNQTESLSLTIKDINNFYVLFNVVQTYPTLGKTISKKIIYDVDKDKITAFITGDGTYMNFLNGLTAFADKDYRKAIGFFDKAAQSDRSSLKKGCLTFAMYSAIRLSDYQTALYYAKMLNNPLLEEYFECAYEIANDQYIQAYEHALKVEQLLGSTLDISDAFKGQIYLMLGLCNSDIRWSKADLSKALKYYLLADSLDNWQAGYEIFRIYSIYNNRFTDVKTATKALIKSALAGYPLAFFPLANLTEKLKSEDSKEEAFKWYSKAAASGSYLGAANIGRHLIEKGEKKEGVEWLEATLEGTELDNEIAEFNLIFGENVAWPNSRSDVEVLLNKTIASTPSSGTPTPNLANSNTQSNNTTPSTSGNTGSTNSYISNSSSHNSNHTSYSNSGSTSSKKFNENKNPSQGGISFGYVEKEWKYSYDDYSENVNVFGEPGSTKGIQIGIRANPQFGYGFGLSTGLYYEYYFGKSLDTYSVDDIDYRFHIKEHCLYFPFHFKYNMNFSSWFQLSFYGGIGLDLGLKGKISAKSGKETLSSFSMYDKDLDMKRFNTSLEYGASVRFKYFQFDLSVGKGLINMSGNKDYTVKQNKILSLCLTICGE